MKHEQHKMIDELQDCIIRAEGITHYLARHGATPQIKTAALDCVAALARFEVAALYDLVAAGDKVALRVIDEINNDMRGL